jgi:hypothetical protein
MNDDSIDNANLGDPIDLSPLDPTRSARFDAIASAITRDATAARARRRSVPPDLVAELAGWTRPALVAAAVVLAIAIPTLARSHRRPQGWVAQFSSVASATDVMGIPQPLVELIRSAEIPSLAQIHDALTPAGVGQ